MTEESQWEDGDHDEASTDKESRRHDPKNGVKRSIRQSYALLYNDTY